jgi:hypothetical protein
MPSQGELNDFPIEEVISLLNEGKKTGALEIEYKNKDNVLHKISIFFKNVEAVYDIDGIKTRILRKKFFKNCICNVDTFFCKRNVIFSFFK